ncbi:MAG: hypothetical protein ACFCVD_24590 [Nodosilinea sp.]
MLLILCVTAAGLLYIPFSSLASLGTAIEPSPWLAGTVALILVTWLMRD